jgi:hypothetical protein
MDQGVHNSAARERVNASGSPFGKRRTNLSRNTEKFVRSFILFTQHSGPAGASDAASGSVGHGYMAFPNFE